MSICKVTLLSAAAMLLLCNAANAVPLTIGAGAVPTEFTPVELVACLHVGGLKVCGDDDRADRREGRQRPEARDESGREEQQRAEIEKARQEGVESGRIRQKMMDRRRLGGAVEKARAEGQAEGRTDGFQTGRRVEKIFERRRADEARRKEADSRVCKHHCDM
jgi:hypothetical protein